MKQKLNLNLIESFYFSSAGNTFIFIDQIKNESVPKEKRSEYVRHLFSSDFGLIADGLVFFEKDSAKGFKWDFYNNDGSSAEMCGNAASAMAYYFDCFTDFCLPVTVKTLAGEIELFKEKKNEYGVVIPDYFWLFRDQRISVLDHREIIAHGVNTGVPHVVIEDRFSSQKERYQVAQKFRFLEGLGPKGANVTFYKPLNQEEGVLTIESVSFERGVENFTRACGTGALASALVFGLSAEKPEIIVDMPGGRVCAARDLVSGKIKYLGRPKFHFKLELNLEEIVRGCC